ncbi:hypothetical protein SEA_KAYLISSA_25 [Arthrobacter phage Kaylissa]|uniref:Uncharacterized protein n=1 Tax=Arthrobacter phage Kaylissa TaxID=2835951 RepID=A0AA92N3T1_9CAUD|nr:hypothetical protein PQE14_gp25 [Arthrobacter phage Kaylissa]QGZ17323.1 hypothetical protein SEA_POWERPUFF_25 [Arthrobacter phage Powerpuff]QIN94516.1 hypothetical protein SEA_YESCHEF_25 [Arthrobacter phage YesChef]QXO14559.1 hypothetical protein SEA_KAYLISSA_25 [Arthrobacter phage Kaylissa]
MTNTTATPATLADIQKAAINSIHSSLTAPDTERTDLLRDAARLFIDARGHFFTREGEPDWRGRTYAYRTWVREVMSAAHVPGDEITSLQAAIRYHSGNLLRDRLGEEEIAELGLRKESPRERSVEKRERTSETLNLFGAGGEIASPMEIVLLCTLAERSLARVNMAGLAANERRAAREALRSLAERASALAS